MRISTADDPRSPQIASLTSAGVSFSVCHPASRDWFAVTSQFRNRGAYPAALTGRLQEVLHPLSCRRDLSAKSLFWKILHLSRSLSRFCEASEPSFRAKMHGINNLRVEAEKTYQRKIDENAVQVLIPQYFTCKFLVYNILRGLSGAGNRQVLIPQYLVRIERKIAESTMPPQHSDEFLRRTSGIMEARTTAAPVENMKEFAARNRADAAPAWLSGLSGRRMRA